MSYLEEEGAPGLQGVEAKDDAQQHTRHRTAPTAENGLAPTVNRAEAG